jgi:hypothetical protein
VKTAVDKGVIPEKEPLLDYCLNNETDVKRADAILVLETIKELMNK